MTELFTKGDTVYTKDGTKWYFDHDAGEFGMVSPFILMQTLTYDQQDFDEIEEPAEHMVPIRLELLSKEPWVHVIHQETADAVAEKKDALDALNKQIGAARTELRVTENNMEKLRLEVEQEARVLERRFQWVKDFRRMIGEEELFMLCEDPKNPDAMPYHISAPTEIRLRKTDGTATWNYSYVGQYEDGEDHIRLFQSESAMDTYISNLFVSKRNDMSVDEQLKWRKHWPKVPITGEAQLQFEKSIVEAAQKKMQAAIDKRDRAQAELDKLILPIDKPA